jgi:hypothetical protein
MIWGFADDTDTGGLAAVNLLSMAMGELKASDRAVLTMAGFDEVGRGYAGWGHVGGGAGGRNRSSGSGRSHRCVAVRRLQLWPDGGKRQQHHRSVALHPRAGVAVGLGDDGFDPATTATLGEFSTALSLAFRGTIRLGEPTGEFRGTTMSGLIGATGPNHTPEGLAPNSTIVGGSRHQRPRRPE